MFHCKNFQSWVLVFSLVWLILAVVPAAAEEATLGLPPLNPSPSIETAPTGLPQMETGQELPSFDNPNQNIFKDAQGKYVITFPQGTTQGQSPDSDLITFILPDQAKAYIPVMSDPEEALESMGDIADDILGQGGNRVGQSTVQAGNKTAQVNLFGMEGGALSKMTGEQFTPGTVYAILMVQYPETNLMFILILPKDAYKNAQPWILDTIKGVVFQ